MKNRFGRKRQLPCCSQCLRLNIREGSWVRLSQGGATGSEKGASFCHKKFYSTGSLSGYLAKGLVM